MDEPAELTTVDALAQLSFATERLFGAHAADSDLSAVQVRLLGILRDRQPTINELARMLDLDKSSVSGLVDRAARRGLVSRAADPRDGRAVRVRLEPPGRALVTRAAERFERDLEHMLGALGPRERQTWTRLTAKLVAADAAARGIRL